MIFVPALLIGGRILWGLSRTAWVVSKTGLGLAAKSPSFWAGLGIAGTGYAAYKFEWSKLIIPAVILFFAYKKFKR